MKVKRYIQGILLLMLGTLINYDNIFAQSITTGQGCAGVEIKKLVGNDTVDLSVEDRNDGITLSCDNPSVTLLPIGFAPGYPDPDNGYYSYEKIDYDPPIDYYSSSLVSSGKQYKITLPVDDCWSRLFDLHYYLPVGEESDTPQFNFFFYENSYQFLMANSNGVLHLYDDDSPMKTYAAQQGKSLYTEPTSSSYIHCPYYPSQAFPDNRAKWGSEVNPTLNGVSAPFCDIHYGKATGNQGMYITFIGEYPCRMCVFSIYDVPMYGNSGSADTANITTMVVLYETTNVIEIYLKRKPAYTSTNSSNSVLGIQNIDGTKAVSITNTKYKGGNTTKSYNNTVWEATNEAWRIKPVGDLVHTMQWYTRQDNNGVPTGDLVQISANSNNQVTANPGASDGATWYYCSIDVTRSEDGKEFTIWDSVLVHPLDVPSLVISHNSADNAQTRAMNADSTSLHDTICAGDKVIFRITGGDEVSFVEPENLTGTPISNGTVTVAQPTDVDFVKYVFKVVNYKNGEVYCTRYDSVFIHKRIFSIDIGSDTAVCPGSTVSYTEHLKEVVGKYLWTFDGGSGATFTTDSISFVPEKGGMLKLVVTDNRGCSQSDEASVIVDDFPVVDILGQKDICDGQKTKLSVQTNVPQVTYQWDDGSTASSIEVSPTANQDYSVTVTTKLAFCSTTQKTTVKVYSIPVIEMYDNPKICERETAVIGVTGNAEMYEWSSLDASVDGGTEAEYTVAPEQTTYYTVTASNNPTLKCQTSGTMIVYVEQKPKPVMDMSPEYIDELTPVVEFTDQTGGIVERMWEISDGETSTDKKFRHTFVLDDTTVSYNVTLIGTTSFGCVDSITRSISVVRDHHIWAPTGIYLHANNPIDREFKMKIDNVHDFDLKIFNRWGTLIYETNDINKGWDCTYKGETVEQGVYTWYVRYHHTDSPDRLNQKSGTFMIYN